MSWTGAVIDRVRDGRRARRGRHRRAAGRDVSSSRGSERVLGDPGEAGARSPEPGRAVLYLCGGGHMLGSPASRRKTAGHLANACAGPVLVPAYRLAPEHSFPAAVEDALAALR